MAVRRPFREVGVPTVHRFGPYRFFFWSHENQDSHEPPHIHVTSGSAHAIFWLDPIRRKESWGYTDHQLAQIRRVILAQQAQLLRRWNDFFGE